MIFQNAKILLQRLVKTLLLKRIMAYDFGALEASVAAAVGDDSALAQDLRRAFLDGVRHHADLLNRSRCDANWEIAAHRLKGLAASFGAVALMKTADFALESAPGDPVALRRVKSAITAIAGDCDGPLL
jgi:HPt (histidine-containing phosphotransfer) domain-containing protein